MPINFNRNENEIKEKNKEFPFSLSANALSFVVPIKADETSFKRLISLVSKLKLERGISSEEELSDDHLQVDRASKLFEQFSLKMEKPQIKKQVWGFHQVEMLRLFADASHLVITESFFKFNPVSMELDIIGGEIEKIKIPIAYWEKLKNPSFGDKDEFSDLYPDLEKIVNFSSYRKNIDKKPLEVMVGIIYQLKSKELENLELMKNHLKNAFSNSELSLAEYNEAIKASEETNFSILLDKYVGIFVQEFANWRNNSSGNSFRK